MKDDSGENHYSVEPFDGSEDTSWTQALARRHGVSEETIAEICEDYEKIHPEVAASSTGSKNAVITEKFARAMLSSKNAALGNRLLLYAFDNRSFDDVLGNVTMVDLGRMFDCSKQAIKKGLEKIQIDLNLPPRADQRGAESRKKMKDRREKNLK